MALQAVRTSTLLSASLGSNPVQTIGMLSITMLAVSALSNLPMAQGEEEGFPWREYCEIACTPLPGGKDDVPERICVKTCEQGKEIIKTTTKEAMKDGKWKAVEVLGKVATPIIGYFDCADICNPAHGGPRAIYNLGSAAWKFLWKKDTAGATADATLGAAQAGCLALLVTPASYAGCMACCAGTKYAGVN